MLRVLSPTEPASKLSYLGEPREDARVRGRAPSPPSPPREPLAASPLARAFSRDSIRSPK